VPTFCTHDHKYPTPEPFLLPWPPNLVQRWCRVRVRSIDIVLYNRQVDNRAEIEDPLWHQSHTLLNDTFETEDVPRTRDPDVSTLSKCHVGSVATQAHASQHACGRGMAGRGEPRWIEHDEPIRARRPDEALIIHLILARGGGECQHRHQLASATEARPPRALACYVCTCVCVCVCVCVCACACVCVCVCVWHGVSGLHDAHLEAVREALVASGWSRRVGVEGHAQRRWRDHSERRTMQPTCDTYIHLYQNIMLIVASCVRSGRRCRRGTPRSS
jgi:hypothetical protein